MTATMLNRLAIPRLRSAISQEAAGCMASVPPADSALSIARLPNPINFGRGKGDQRQNITEKERGSVLTKINCPTDGKCGYIAFYNGQEAEVYADSSFQATERAKAHFKPPKSKRHLVHVVLAETNGKEVVHTPDM
jgi:hypothetical protein